MTNPEDPIFYTYIILDPRHTGTFIYDGGKLTLDYLPIYGGKGLDDRCEVHAKDAINTDIDSDKLNLLREIIEDGYEPKIIKILENVTEQEAFAKERYIIRVVGRVDLGLGPLLNKTNGGEGCCGYIPTEETIEKLRKAQIRRFENPEERLRYSEMSSGEKNGMYGKTHSEETRKLISDSQRGEKHSQFGKK
jgi:group I intron endonuclease